jgi:hypothetical protein
MTFRVGEETFLGVREWINRIKTTILKNKKIYFNLFSNKKHFKKHFQKNIYDLTMLNLFDWIFIGF